MKQAYYVTRSWVNPREIGAFVEVAAMASQRQVGCVVQSAMLLRNDVFDVMEQVTVLLRQPAVFATRAGSFTNESPRFSIHAID
jgi:hypothetical protein